MRSDMFKVIVERPRLGGDGGKSIPHKKYKKKLRRESKNDFEDSCTKESMKTPYIYGYEGKTLNEHLSPLRRYLHKQIGRPWDKVWSEMCRLFSADNAVTGHVRDHADDYVSKHVQMVEKGKKKVPCEIMQYGTGLSEVDGFYVHPETGLLCFNKVESYRSSYRRRKRQIDRFTDPDNPLIQYRLLRSKCKKCKDMRVEGETCEHTQPIWYEITLARYEWRKTVKTYGFPPTQHITTCRVDVETGKEINDILDPRSTESDLFRRYLTANVYAKSKRQLNKRDLKRLRPIIENLSKVA